MIGRLVTFYPDPAVAEYDYDPEYPCTKFWHSHSLTVAEGRVSKLVPLVPYAFTVNTDAICQSYS
jgi:hypothetical protein